MCVCIYVYIYIHKYIHVYIHMHMNMFAWRIFLEGILHTYTGSYIHQKARLDSSDLCALNIHEKKHAYYKCMHFHNYSKVLGLCILSWA
jgi:hypothetical protein